MLAKMDRIMDCKWSGITKGKTTTYINACVKLENKTVKMFIHSNVINLKLVFRSDLSNVMNEALVQFVKLPYNFFNGI
jgi:hypothetical protein